MNTLPLKIEDFREKNVPNFKCRVLSPPKPSSSVSYCLASSPTSTLGHVSVVDLTFMWYIRRGLGPIYYIATHCAGLTWGLLSARRRPEISRLDMQLHNSPRPAVHAAWPARRFSMVLLKLLYIIRRPRLQKSRSCSQNRKNINRRCLCMSITPL